MSMLWDPSLSAGPPARLMASGFVATAIAAVALTSWGGSRVDAAPKAEPIDQVRSLLLGRSGPQLPLDYTEREGLKIDGRADLPEVSGSARIKPLGDGPGFQVYCEGLRAHLRYQKKDFWCWAAAVQTLESYALGDSGDAPTQEEVVARVYPDLENRTALSFQMMWAMADQHYRDEIELEQLEVDEDNEFQVATKAVVKSVLDVFTAGDQLEVQQVLDSMDRVMGTRELVESLARGEPVLASLGHASDQPHDALRHIYVIGAVDAVSVRRKSSVEWKLSTAIQSLRLMLDKDAREGFRDRIGGFGGKAFDNLKKVKNPFSSSQQYALEWVYMLDPIPIVGLDGEERVNLEPKVLSGAQFAELCYFILNKSEANRVLGEIVEERRKQLEQMDVEAADAAEAAGSKTTADP